MANHNHQELINLRRAVVRLASEIDYKNHLLMEKEGLSLEKFATMSSLIEEKDRLLGERSAVIGSLMAQQQRLHTVFVEEKRKCEQLKQETKNIMRELEVQQQKGGQKLDAKNEDLKAQLEKLEEKLKEKGEAFDQLKSLNQTLVLSERSSTEELKAGRTEAIKYFVTMDGDGAKIGIKRVGKIDPKPFRDVCSKKICSGNWEEESEQLYSLWQENVYDSSWNPFKKEIKSGEANEVVDENEKKLNELREECGEEAYQAVVSALLDLKEYNPSLSSSMSELWNFEEGRRAYLKEVIQYMAQKWELYKSRCSEQSRIITELTGEKQKLLQASASTKFLMEEKDKLLKEKYAEINRLMVQDMEKDKLLAQMSSNISTLTAEKYVQLGSCSAGKRMTKNMEQSDKLNQEMLSQEKLAKRTEVPNETKPQDTVDNKCMEIKEDNMGWYLGFLTEHTALGPIAEKLKKSQTYNIKDQLKATLESKMLRGQSTGELLTLPKTEPDMLRKSSDGSRNIIEVLQPRINLNLLPFEAVVPSLSVHHRSQYSMALERFFPTANVKKEDEG